MALRNKIDSNETSGFYAEEESLGVLPTSPAPVWKPLEPNSYSDFGGELTLLARRPINANRQRKKGVITDLDAAGGINQDFTQNNTRDLLQGVMFADIRTKASYVIDTVAGELDVVIPSGGGYPIITGIDFEALGIIPGEWIFIGGDDAGMSFANPENNGFKRVGGFFGSPVNGIIIDQSANEMVEETTSTETIRLYLGQVLKNELGALIKRRSYQFERQLGAPDTDNPSQIQSEYLVGSILNEFVMNIEQADKINWDMNIISIDNEQRTATQGIKAGDRETLQEADAFNTSSDFVSMRMAIYDPENEAPSELFAFVTDLSITINNNVQPNKAVAVLGAFDVTAGIFEVSGEATAYFSTIEAVQAIRNNENVSIHAIVAKNNAGFVIDLPLIALGDGRLNVEIDEPITLPISMDAATAAAINADLDYTALWVFFDTLPNAAMPD